MFFFFNFVFEYQEMLGPEGPLAAGHVLGVLISFLYFFITFQVSFFYCFRFFILNLQFHEMQGPGGPWGRGARFSGGRQGK